LGIGARKRLDIVETEIDQLECNLIFGNESRRTSTVCISVNVSNHKYLIRVEKGLLVESTLSSVGCHKQGYKWYTE
jgi:hypothetical protein